MVRDEEARVREELSAREELEAHKLTYPTVFAYYYADSDKKAVGPYSLDQLHSLAARGIITLTTNVICKGDERWEDYKDKYGRLP